LKSQRNQDLKITQLDNQEQTSLKDLARLLLIRRKFYNELNEEGLYLVNYFIVRAFRGCTKSGFIQEARNLIKAAEFENAQLPETKSVKKELLAEIFLSRLERINFLLEQGKRFINAQKRQKILEKALVSTIKDLTNLGLESKTTLTIDNPETRNQQESRENTQNLIR